MEPAALILFFANSEHMFSDWNKVDIMLLPFINPLNCFVETHNADNASKLSSMAKELVPGDIAAFNTSDIRADYYSLRLSTSLSNCAQMKSLSYGRKVDE